MKAKFLPLLLLAILLQVSMFSFANEMTSARRIRLKNKTEVQHRSIPVTPDACIENSLLSIDLLSLKKRYGFNTQSFYVKGELIPLVKGSLEEKLSYQQKLRSRIVQALVDSLYQKADIKRFLYPPKQPECVVRDLCVYYRGNLDSPVSFIVASDYNCERCVQFEKTLSKLYDNYKERVKFGFVHFADAPSLAALACEAAGEQKQFWTFHDTIFNYSGVADSAFIYNLAKSKRLNMTEFDAYLHSSDKYKEMDKVINQLVERGLMATPTIIINDRLVYVTNSYEELSRLLEYEL